MDYKALGLVAGIEIHQQLDTKEKLFCHCPTALREISEDSGEFSAISGQRSARWEGSIARRWKR